MMGNKTLRQARGLLRPKEIILGQGTEINAQHPTEPKGKFAVKFAARNRYRMEVPGNMTEL